MPTLILLITVVTLLIGGQALLLAVLRAGLVVALAAAALGAVSRDLGRPSAASTTGRRGVPHVVVPVERVLRAGA